MTAALIMAGGRSARMRMSNGPQHKALVNVQGHTLLEHNVEHLVGEGLLEIYIAISAAEEELRLTIDSSIATMITNAGGRLTTIVEHQSLGTIGAAGQVDAEGPLLVVNVDNLTDLSYRDLLRFHRNRRADLTIASHLERFQIPFGQLEFGENDVIMAYREKPQLPIAISSGIYVLSDNAKQVIPPGKRFDITDLFMRLSDDGLTYRTLAYRHNQRWVDVNDLTQLELANQLFASREQN